MAGTSPSTGSGQTGCGWGRGVAVRDFRFLASLGMTESRSRVIATNPFCIPHVSPWRGRGRWEQVDLRDVHGAEAVLGEEEEHECDADGTYYGGGERNHAVFEALEVRGIDAV